MRGRGAAARRPEGSCGWRSASPAPARPRGAAEAAAAALQAGAPMGYTEAFGLRSLRARIARTMPSATARGAAERIAVTVGASGAFPLAFLAAFDPGDRVAMAAPFYPPYANILTALGHAAADPRRAGDRWQPTLAMLEALDPPPGRADLASPCNPAGTMLPPRTSGHRLPGATRNGVRLISDEIYHGLNYGRAERDGGRVRPAP